MPKVDVKIMTWGEGQNEYRLEDGTVLRTRHVLTKVIRNDDVRGPNGEPTYELELQMLPPTQVIPVNLCKPELANQGQPGHDDKRTLQ